MEQLGDDEFVSIFNKIDNEVDRKSFMKVSKKFMKVACIRLYELHNLFPALLSDILPASPNLVSFRCYKPLSNSHLKLLAQSCPMLFELELGSLVDSEFDFDDDGLCAVANACIRLTKVYLRGRLHVGDDGIHSLVTSSKNISVLDLSNCISITDESLKAIGKASSLKVLSLDGCYLITDLGLKYLANGEVKNRLISLNLSGCDRISDDGIIYLKEMVTLQSLDLSKCGINVTDTGIVAMLSQLPNMNDLDLSWLINVTNISLFVISTKCLKLVFICLDGCEAITREGLRAFAHHPCLRNLDLFSSHNFSWADVKSVALTCSKLESIGLSNKIEMSMEDEYIYRINNCRVYWE